MEQGILCRVRAYIEKYYMIVSGDTVIAGVSGGADSVCLFLMLAELMKEIKFRLVVVHVNHGIRAEAVQEAEFVRQLCGDRKIPFILVEENIKEYARAERISEEEAGRKVRYRAFEEAVKKYAGNNLSHGNNSSDGNRLSAGKIAVAHNANDRAETMLFHLFRGTGLAGAGGIRPVRDNIIRPILCLQRREIEEYLREKQMTFCIDRTNLEDTYTRNRIRNHILPYAEKEICQGAVEHMCETADILLETEGYIAEQTGKAYANCILEENEDSLVLDVNRIKEETPFIRKQIILKALERLTQKRKDITSLHIKAILELFDKNGTKETMLPYGLTVRKEYNRLILQEKSMTEATVGTVTETAAEAAAGMTAGAITGTAAEAKAGMTTGAITETAADAAAGMTPGAITETAADAATGITIEADGKKNVQIWVPDELEEGRSYEMMIPGLGIADIALYSKEASRDNDVNPWNFLEKSKDIPEKSCTKWFDYDRITKSLIFRTRETGDYLTINKNMSKKTLKDYMIGEKIPKYLRGSLYILTDGSHVVWVPGYRISEYYKITEDTKRILQVQLRGGL